MEKPKVVLINTIRCEQNSKLKEIVKELLQVDDVPTSDNITQDIESYAWHVDTKYYEADINVSILKNKSIVNEKFSESVEAVVLYFDSGKNSQGLNTLKTWLPFVDTWQPGIKLAVCEKCDRDGLETLSRVSMQEWCLDNELELVELEPDKEDYDELEDFGVKRIRNALMAHMWPNMEMKNPQNAVKKIQPSACGGSLIKGTLAPPETAETRINGLLGGSEFDEILEDDDEDDFEKLFCQMNMMKERAGNLPEEERKKYAENVVKAFWTALGGDEEEISSSEESEQKNVVEGDIKR